MPAASPVGRWDLELGGIPLRFQRDRRDGHVVPAARISADAGREVPRNDVPVGQSSFRGGSGYPEAGLVEDGYHFTKNLDCRYGPATNGPKLTQVTLPSGMGVIKGGVELGGHLYFVGGNKYARIPTLNDDPTDDGNTLGVGFEAESICVFNDVAYVGGNGSIKQITAPSTVATVAGITRRHLTTVSWEIAGVSATRLVGSDGDNSFYYTINDHTVSDPNDWSAALTIGESTRTIRSLVSSGEHVYVVKTDGVYDVTATGRHPRLTGYFQFSTDNGAHSVWADGYIYVTTAWGLDRFWTGRSGRQDTPGYPLPHAYLGAEGGPSGIGTALTVDQGWIVVALYDGNGDAWVGWGVDRSVANVPGPGPMLWHFAPIFLENERVTYLHVASNGRLWVASDNGSGGSIKLRWAPLAVGATPLTEWANDGDYTFALSGQLFCSRQHWGVPIAPKTLHSIEVVSRNIETGSVLVRMKADDGQYARQGNATRGPVATITPTPEAIRGYQFTPVFELTGTDTEPVILDGWRATANVKLPERTVQTYYVQWGTGADPDDHRDPRRVRDALLRLIRNDPVTLYDHHTRETLSVTLDTRLPIRRVGDGQGERWLGEITATVLKRRLPVLVTDSGHLTDQGYAAG